MDSHVLFSLSIFSSHHSIYVIIGTSLITNILGGVADEHLGADHHAEPIQFAAVWTGDTGDDDADLRRQ